MYQAELDKLKNLFIENSTVIKNEILDVDLPNKSIDIITPYSTSKKLLTNYVTLDYDHAVNIIDLIEKIQNYVKDLSITKPLNFVMIANSGYGKSYFIKSLAEEMAKDNIVPITFNMSNMEEISNFLYPLEEIRNLKISDKLPLLFIDEFDSHDDNYSLLLPLMWDGELYISNQTLKLGKLVIILAGSKKRIKDIIRNINNDNKKFKLRQGESKLIDLLSRINGGVFNIPDLDYKRGDRNRRVDKICLTISLLKKRFGQDLHEISWALLKFIAETKFKYGVRSIAYFIDLITNKLINKNQLTIEDLKRLPFNSVSEFRKSILVYHIVLNKSMTIAKIISKWGNLMKNNSLVTVSKKISNTWWDVDF